MGRWHAGELLGESKSWKQDDRQKKKLPRPPQGDSGHGQVDICPDPDIKRSDWKIVKRLLWNRSN
jgi:hypothetical protein